MQLNICFIGRAIFRCYRVVVSGSKPLLIKGGVGEDCRYREGRRLSLSLRKGFPRALRDWLLREPRLAS